MRLSASLFPAPMPPVIATATGRSTLAGGSAAAAGSASLGSPRLGRRRGLGGRLVARLGASARSSLRGGRLDAAPRLRLDRLGSASAASAAGSRRLPRLDGGSDRARAPRRRLDGSAGLGAGSASSTGSAARRLRLGAAPRRRSPRRLGAARRPSASERSRFGVRCTDSPPSARGWTGSSGSTRFSDSESRRRSPSISMILTLTAWPCATTSRGFSTWCCASSEMCTSPSTPGRISTKAPKVTTFVTRPSTTSPSP